MSIDFISPTRRDLFAMTAGVATLATFGETAMAQPAVAQGAVRPFKYHAPEEALVDLRRRVAATRWPDRETVSNSSEGVQLAMIQKVAQYWAGDYDWRPVEARLNALPQFMTEIDGLDFHFIHVRSKHDNALPLIVNHGWPGSIIEQMKIIAPLTDPTAHGGTAADAFHVVIPSMPGYGFSARPTETGWDTTRIARAWATLMQRLGYDRYVAQGGDWGAGVVDLMGLQAPPGLLGIHSNMPFAMPEEVSGALFAGKPVPPNMSPDEQYAFDRLKFFFTDGLSYAQQMANHPQTLYALADSPMGLAAWFLDHDIRSYELIGRVFDGHSEGLTRDDVLDNLTLTWLTNTAISTSRLYRESKTIAFFAPTGVKLPVAVSAFPDELYQVPESWARRAYPNLIHYNRLEKGGHFAAWEQPTLLTQEIRAGFRTLR